MSWRCRYLRQMQILLPYTQPGNRLPGSRKVGNLWVPSLVGRASSYESGISSTKFQSFRCLSTSLVSNEDCYENGGVVSFIESCFVQLQGRGHCWLNVEEGSEEFSHKDEAFLVLAGDLVRDVGIVAMFERVKALQQRFPQLRVIGFHSGQAGTSTSEYAYLVEVVMKEFITFPILSSNKSFPEMNNGACYILFADLKYPSFYREKDLDSGTLDKAVEVLLIQQKMLSNENARSSGLKTTWFKQAEIIKEPTLCSVLRNLFLYFPGCVSADETSGRLFLSDSNHHRIIILDGDGNLLDCIGSRPGFEDGEFESAKLFRPASTFYHDAEDCLYIVDSENHAIRRADMDRRVLETLHPTYNISNKNNGIWKWISEKLSFGRKLEGKLEQVDSGALSFPWHFLKSEEDSFIIISRSFENLWIMDMASGKVKEFIKGYAKVMETCEQLIADKVSLLKQIPKDRLLHQTESLCLAPGLPCPSLVSNVSTLQNNIIICDSAAQRLLKLSTESGPFLDFQFSNFGILGLPYWLSSPLERVYTSAETRGTTANHLESFTLFPGKIDIQVNITIPLDTELVEPLQEGCIWRQARGAACILNRSDDVVGYKEKVGVAQQWYDELDNLAFTTPELDTDVEDDDSKSVVKPQDDKIHIDCAVNTSSGTSEVIIYAALYLKLRRHPEAEVGKKTYAERIANILYSGGVGGMDRDLCVQHLLKSESNLRDLIFMKPLQLRVKLNCLDHPKAKNERDIILTDSDVEVNVSLDT